MSDPQVTFIVPVHGKSGIYLSRCINSLLDNQDYPKKDVVVVYDGKENQMGGALKQEESFKEDSRVRFFTIENGGACKARNFGKSKAEGDILCFFDCDSMLRAGAIRTWLQAFKENPDCGFVYGGYRFALSQGYNDGVPAKPFDPYLLTCNNYISTMNPIKREVCVDWNEELSSLQDWDFWLRVVRSGVRGHFIKDFLVVTEPPDDESITGDSHRNWTERVKAVRENNGIRDRNIAITSMGAEFQGIRRAKILGGDYKDPQMMILKPNDYKAVVSMGYYVNSSVHPFSVFANSNGAKKIIHFIGTDVLQLSCRKFREVVQFRETMPQAVDHMFCNAPWLQEELKEMGIESELLYCPIDFSPYRMDPLPEEFTLAVYRSDSNPVHSEPFMLDLARATPDIQWRFFGGSVPTFGDLPENIKFMGTISEPDMPDFIAKTSALMRVTVHDGFPATVAEWIVSGRPVICNLKDMPFTRHLDIQPSQGTWVNDKEKAVKEIRKLQTEISSITQEEKDKARQHYVDLLDPQKYKKRMMEVCLG